MLGAIGGFAVGGGPGALATIASGGAAAPAAVAATAATTSAGAAAGLAVGQLLSPYFFAGESSATASGRQAHADYSEAMSGQGYVTNKQSIPGTRLRPDAIDTERGIIRELKPNNRGRSRGVYSSFSGTLMQQRRHSGGDSEAFWIPMVPDDRYYGFALYCASDLRQRPRLVTGALQDLGAVWPDRTVEWQGLLAGSDRHTRLAQVAEMSLDETAQQIRVGKYSDVLVFVGDGRGDRVTLSVQLVVPEPTRHTRIQYLQSLRDGDSLALATTAARVLWHRFAPVYGLAVIRGSAADVSSELTGLIVNRPGAQLTREEEDRLFTLQDLRPRLGEVARVPAWDTFLGKNMVERLGGADRVRREAPVARVGDFPEGALHLRLSEAGEPWGSLEWVRQNQALAKFLGAGPTGGAAKAVEL